MKARFPQLPKSYQHKKKSQEKTCNFLENIIPQQNEIKDEVLIVVTIVTERFCSCLPGITFFPWHHLLPLHQHLDAQQVVQGAQHASTKVQILTPLLVQK